MMADMTGKVAIVTGASSGIGRATALRFAAAGMKIALVARRATELAELEGKIRAEGGEANGLAADVTRTGDIDRVVSETVAAFGGIDVVVNAAGIIANGTIENTTVEGWDQMFSVNVRAPFYLMQRAMPYLIERQGNVVNVSSVTGVRAFPGVLAYCSSKAALDQMTHCVALEVAGNGVRVNAINPGVTITMLHRSGGMDDAAYAAFLEKSKATHPLGRLGTAEEVADLIYFLASPQAGWITGVSYSIDGGRAQTCLR
jgi:NAD(P)-dependent dehydrogenase (short-subunit alcohol dehydrogenase family)